MILCAQNKKQDNGNLGQKWLSAYSKVDLSLTTSVPVSASFIELDAATERNYDMQSV